MAIFEPAFEVLLKHEGGYVNDPQDPGGETKYGISKRQYPEVDIASLSEAAAAEIYRRDFWGRCGEIYDQDVATKVFDLGVLCGVKTSVKMLQRAVCACGHVIDVDGSLGPGTLCGANAIPPGELLSTLKDEAAEHFRGLVRKRPELQKFEAGWLNRALS